MPGKVFFRRQPLARPLWRDAAEETDKVGAEGSQAERRAEPTGEGEAESGGTGDKG